jgi:telomerase reverse transcriptase
VGWRSSQKLQESVALQAALGVSAVRLIPKPNGFRPIVNLGRRIVRFPRAQGNADRQGAKKGRDVLARNAQKSSTANNLLRGVHQVLSYEKV